MQEPTSEKTVTRQWYHDQLPLCVTRAKYRQGRQLTAVKVYTVLDESSHLLINNVTCVDVRAELLRLCQRFGRVAGFDRIAGYQTQRFTSAFHVQYTRVAAARYAKRNLDDRNFYGTHLMVCYAPELEELGETARKMTWRQTSFSRALNRNNEVEISRDEASTTEQPVQGYTDEDRRIISSQSSRDLAPRFSGHVKPVDDAENGSKRRGQKRQHSDDMIGSHTFRNNPEPTSVKRIVFHRKAS